MAAELPVMLHVLADDLENNFFGEEDDDCIVLSSAASIFARKNLNRILGHFEQTIATYSVDEFKAYCRMQRATCHGYGKYTCWKPIWKTCYRPKKQILIYLCCMASQESARLVADRFNITFRHTLRR